MNDEAMLERKGDGGIKPAAIFQRESEEVENREVNQLKLYGGASAVNYRWRTRRESESE